MQRCGHLQVHAALLLRCTDLLLLCWSADRFICWHQARRRLLHLSAGLTPLWRTEMYRVSMPFYRWGGGGDRGGGGQ